MSGVSDVLKEAWTNLSIWAVRDCFTVVCTCVCMLCAFLGMCVSNTCPPIPVIPSIGGEEINPHGVRWILGTFRRRAMSRHISNQCGVRQSLSVASVRSQQLLELWICLAGRLHLGCDCPACLDQAFEEWWWFCYRSPACVFFWKNFSCSNYGLTQSWWNSCFSGKIIWRHSPSSDAFACPARSK